MKITILTNMVAPYRVPFFKALAGKQEVSQLRILTCVEREADREWSVENSESYETKQLAGLTLNLQRGGDGKRILHFRFGILWELLRHRPDRLVIGDASWTSFIAVFCCLQLRIPYVVWNEITTTSKVSAGLVSRLRQWMYRHAYKLVASCQMAKDFLLANGVPDEKIDIVWNAVDNQFYQTQRNRWEPKREALRKELGIAEDAFCFIYVGQLISRKRVLETLELLAKTRADKPFHLLVAGTGPLEQAMKDKAESLNFDAITFCGFAKPERLCQLYVASDALVLLSDDEPWGMVINEILLFGKPYLASESVAAAKEFYSVCPNCKVSDYSLLCKQSSCISDFISANDFFNKEVVCSMSTPFSMAKYFLSFLK